MLVLDFWPPQPQGISVLSGDPVLVLCYPGNECSLWTAEGPARRRGDERRRRRGRETEDPPKARALGHTEPLLLSVPSGGAAHRSGERRPPDTREEVGRSLHQVEDGTREQS